MGSKNWFTWPRVLCVLITGGLLWWACRDLHLGEVLGVMRRADPWSFVAALLAYAVALVLAAYVWHVALRVVGCGAHPLAANRFALIGHFFFVALFGAVGCDLAKSSVYARWYRFGLPEVLAAAPLERALRLVGAILLGVVVVIIGALSGGMTVLARLRLGLSPLWIAVAAVLCVGLVLVIRYFKPTGHSFIARLRRAMRSGISGLIRARRLTTGGIVAAVFAQATASAVLAFCLAGVTDTELPWSRLVWTFPAIVVVSALPFTVAGTGVREVAAVMLLGIYGVPAEQAVAASLLSLVQKLILAAFGAVAWWREERLQKRGDSEPLPQRVSVVIPTMNEASCIRDAITAAQAIPEVCEIIVADGGSTDGTVAIAEGLGCRTLRVPASRGRQLRAGATHATGDVILFLHADTVAPPRAGKALLHSLRDVTVVGGGFWKRYRKTPAPLIGARVKCFFRLIFTKRILGDQGLFVRRNALEAIGGVPDLPLMEDVELCSRLRKTGRLALADATVLASARRFAECGYLRTTWLTWKLSILYRLGRSPESLAPLYRPHRQEADASISAEPEPEPLAARQS